MALFTRKSHGLKAVLPAILIGVMGFVTTAHAEEGAEVALDIREGEAPDTCDAARPQVRIATSGQTAVGILTVELYNDDTRNFLEREGRLRRARVPARSEVQHICFDIDGPGTYAVAGYHDIDADRNLDKKWNRLPKEPFGLSNNPKLKLRKPRHYEAAFEVGAGGADIELLIYRR